ncbi:ECU02_1395 [Encephalitozoon cuniculi GB-M1]|uniref:ECU02_1395 protein n=1 Tax=Encephalitozoon cuniculi (strain GB-M1) TaxID=284813 RepID=I7JTZ3_ENCCU|nr:uncharacterized protein ECU02_1395 [Encephalitozoon cuniculi GB-M1]UYI28333.1 hypothetical protein J0A71_10g22390 [Encephalitozoon cuniculi]CCI73914.1 ECU02_1395 [Encephalitozoon cuniculi GB-M1]
MAGISEKLKGLKFMQKAERKKNDDCEVSFSTYFCRKGVFSYNNKQKIHEQEDEIQKKAKS